MILLSNGGHNTHRSAKPSDTIVVGTVDGVAVLARSDNGWTLSHRGLAGCFVSAVTVSDDGTLFAATHGVGVARSRDGGKKWQKLATGISSGISSGAFLGDGRLVLVSTGGDLIVSDNDGDTFVRIAREDSTSLNGIAVTRDNGLVLVGEHGTLTASLKP